MREKLERDKKTLEEHTKNVEDRVKNMESIIMQLQNKHDFEMMTPDQRRIEMDKTMKEIKCIEEQRNQRITQLKKEIKDEKRKKYESIDEAHKTGELARLETKKKLVDEEIERLRVLINEQDKVLYGIAVQKTLLNEKVRQEKSDLRRVLRDNFKTKQHEIEQETQRQIDLKRSRYDSKYWNEYETLQGDKRKIKRPHDPDEHVEPLTKKKKSPIVYGITDTDNVDEEMLKSVLDWLWTCCKRGYTLKHKDCSPVFEPFLPWRSKVGRDGNGLWVEEVPVKLLTEQWIRDTKFFPCMDHNTTKYFTRCLLHSRCKYVSEQEKRSFVDPKNDRFTRRFKLNNEKFLASTYIIIKQSNKKLH